jgi:hypothetical protein
MARNNCPMAAGTSLLTWVATVIEISFYSGEGNWHYSHTPIPGDGCSGHPTNYRIRGPESLTKGWTLLMKPPGIRG